MTKMETTENNLLLGASAGYTSSGANAGYTSTAANFGYHEGYQNSGAYITTYPAFGNMPSKQSTHQIKQKITHQAKAMDHIFPKTIKTTKLNEFVRRGVREGVRVERSI